MTSGLTLDSPLSDVKGIGPKKLEALGRMGLRRIEDLLYHFPRDYEDRRGICSFGAVSDGMKAGFRAKVLSFARQRSFTRRGMTLLKARLCDGTDEAEALWFNAWGVEHFLTVGGWVALWGTVRRQGVRVQIHSPEVEPLRGPEAPSDLLGRIVPLYPLTEGFSQRQMTALVDQALSLADDAEDPLPAALVAERRWPGLAEALREVHRPASDDRRELCRRRVVFGEFLQLQLALALRGKGWISEEAPRLCGDPTVLRAGLTRGLGFDLTQGQKAVLADIDADLEGAVPMNRLLQGDVGSGKTAVALCAMLKAVASGRQAVLMAPTSVLADQHYGLMKRVLEPLGIQVGLLVGSLKAAARRQVLEGLRDGSIQMAVGTHALVQDGVEFHDLGLAVIDEQHRFGVRQRLTLSRSGGRPHRLVMTATPIPRTLTLALYGDLTQSILREKPGGRQPVKTRIVDMTRYEGLLGYLNDEVARGRQVYWVCSLIEDSDVLDAKALEDRFAELKIRLPHLRMAALHSRLPADEKDGLMRDFAAGRIDMLVSTTVIEVGVDVPNATVMVIENPERFGLSQLHQLRGRVGRGSEESWCFLLLERGGVSERLRRFTATDDGFLLAEYDLETRGPGEFCGTRQHGHLGFRLGSLVRDGDLMADAQKTARRIVDAKALSPRLKDLVCRRFASVMDIAQTG